MNTATPGTRLSPATAELPPLTLQDRVVDAYFGDLGVAAQQETRERLHWICEQVQGPRVLDAGCRQGVTTWLLAQQGHEVTGLERTTTGLARAQALLAREPEAVLQRVELVQGSWPRRPTAPVAFDTLVLQAAQEALARPADLLEAARHDLRPGGRLVATWPLGIGDDGEAPLYLLQPLRLLATGFEVQTVAILGRWIGITGLLRAETLAGPPPLEPHEARVSALEAGFARLERSLRQELRTARDTVHQVNLKYRTVTAQVHTYRQRLAEEEAARQQLQARMEAQPAPASPPAEADDAATLQARRWQVERLEVQLLQARQRADELRQALERSQQRQRAAEEQAERTRQTFSFRLGYALLHGLDSPGSLWRLPGQLWRLHREGVRRRRQRHEVDHAAPVMQALRPPPALPPVTTEPASTDDASPGAETEVPASEVLRALRVAAIMDEFTFASFEPECQLLSLSVDEWQAELDRFRPDLVFIESAWRGKDERWGGRVGHLSAEVQGVLAWCREHRVPTAFWNKEDPIHFETFLNTARLFDHVFTTDIDCIPRYKASLGHERVHLLPFACQPGLSNPVEKYTRKDAFCFAGAYYARYPERTRDLGHFIGQLPAYRPVEIFDRNFGKDDPGHRFPPEYQPFIVGTLPFDRIDQAYKGYRYAINLNSIKQSHSMFARRVFELLASNTLTISNYSPGVRLLFGDLVVTSDSGEELVRRLRRLEASPQQAALLRLAGLRKVMQEHTYQDRLAFVAGQLRGRPLGRLLPDITVTAYAKNQAQWASLWQSYRQQVYPHKRLLVVMPDGFCPDPGEAGHDPSVRRVNALDLAGSAVSEWVDQHGWIAGMVPDDHYGHHYLTDLALATRYAGTLLVGKGSHAVWSPSDGQRRHAGAAPYTRTDRLPARASLVGQPVVAGMDLKEWVTSLYTRTIEWPDALSIDPFSYCRNGASAVARLRDLGEPDDSAPALDTGLPLERLMAMADAAPPQAPVADTAPVLRGDAWAGWFKPPAGKAWRCEVDGTQWRFESDLGDGQHDYLYASRDVPPAEVGTETALQVHLDTGTGLNLQLVVLFLDGQRQRIGHVVKAANRNHDIALPAGTAFLRFGVRIYGGGSACIHALVLGHRPLPPAVPVPRAQVLLLTNHYPSYDDLYRNGFVHSRVRAYRERGLRVDVFRLRADQPTSHHEFQNVDVLTGSPQALHQQLATGHYRTVLVHFLDAPMWEVLRHHIDRVRVVVWLHGADIQSYQRRAFVHDTEEEHRAAQARSDERMAFWRALLDPMPANLHLVFVSRYLAESSMDDLGIRLPEDRFSIVPNPIDTDLFSYLPKPPEQRRKILSIRPYASRIYANDLTVAAILELSRTPCFRELEFRLIGDGRLFDSLVEPLHPFPNVVVEKRFLTQQDIARLHRQYGVFLCPTRMDTQGVSRDEAMASGLVPVTNAVAAVPEFVGADQGVLCPPESATELAAAIEALALDGARFEHLSRQAAASVRHSRGVDAVIRREMALIQEH